jgi:hypothetical protein
MKVWGNHFMHLPISNIPITSPSLQTWPLPMDLLLPFSILYLPPHTPGGLHWWRWPEWNSWCLGAQSRCSRCAMMIPMRLPILQTCIYSESPCQTQPNNTMGGMECRGSTLHWSPPGVQVDSTKIVILLQNCLESTWSLPRV